MPRRIALVTFPVVDQYPLASGYLHSYARTNDSVRQAFEFSYFQETIATASYNRTLDRLRQLDAEIYCFSSYVWNMGLVRRLIDDLEKHDGVKKIFLGGHQISGQISTYVKPHQDKIVVVNGPGEVPFRDALAALAEGRELSTVSGISCYVDGEMYEGGMGAQLPSPDEIPSPFLEGLFDSFHHTMTVFETTRGCPYQCTFCTWGGPTLKVTKFSTERVIEELEWVGQHSVFFLYLADANWGMLPRDIELSERIGSLKLRFGTPWGVYYAAAKNNPKGSVECIKALHRAGVITAQALGIQSMNEETLAAVKRKNIKGSVFLEMFNELQADGVSSYCELIWPLPQEDLASLKRSFQRLVDINAPTVILYPTILINNAQLTADAVQYGMSVVPADDWKTELRIVTSTATASAEMVSQGFWFYYSYFLLGNCDGYKALFRFAADVWGVSASDLTTRFSEYLQTAARDSDYARFVQKIFDTRAHGDLRTIGALVCHLTHERKASCQRLVGEFLVRQFESNASDLLAFLVVWAMAMPRVFGVSEPTVRSVMSSLRIEGAPPFEVLAQVIEDDGRGNASLSVFQETNSFRKALSFFGVEVAPDASITEIRRTEKGNSAATQRLPYGADVDRNQAYAHGMIQRLAEITPVFRVA